MKKFTGLIATMLTGAMVMAGSTATAATVTFDGSGFVNQGGTPFDVFDITLTDITGGVKLTLSPSAGASITGDTLLIGLEGATLGLGNFSNVSTNTGDGITAVCNNVSTCGGGGGGFTGGSFNSFTFDTVVRIGTNGSASGLNTMVMFDMLAAGLDVGDFSAVGIRIQTVSGAGGTTSLKLINRTPTTIPLPAAGLLLLGALGGLGMTGWRRRRMPA